VVEDILVGVPPVQVHGPVHGASVVVVVVVVVVVGTGIVVVVEVVVVTTVVVVVATVVVVVATVVVVVVPAPHGYMDPFAVSKRATVAVPRAFWFALLWHGGQMPRALSRSAELS